MISYLVFFVHQMRKICCLCRYVYDRDNFHAVHNRFMNNLSVV